MSTAATEEGVRHVNATVWISMRAAYANTQINTVC